MDLLTGGWSRFTAFNADIVAGTVFPDARAIRWTAPDDGVEIEGVLMTPRGADGPLPLIVCVHGGPTWNWGAFFSDREPNAVLLASAGYACLLPNPRGSVGRGHAFAQGVIGDGGGIDYRDIMAGIDHCIAEGIADPEKGAASRGFSYGGYMAGWAVGQTDRFGASVAMSVVSNYVSFHLTSEVWWYDQAILEGEWNDPKSQYVDRAPVTHAIDARRRPSSCREPRIDARRPVRARSFTARSRKRAPKSNSWCIRGRVTCPWNVRTLSTRSGGRRSGSIVTCWAEVRR